MLAATGEGAAVTAATVVGAAIVAAVNVLATVVGKQPTRGGSILAGWPSIVKNWALGPCDPYGMGLIIAPLPGVLGASVPGKSNGTYGASGSTLGV